MLIKNQKSEILIPFTVLIFSALLIQLLGKYHATKIFVIGEYFCVLWIMLRIIIPVIILYAIKIPISKLGIGLPQIDKNLQKQLIIMALILILAFACIYFYDTYFIEYSANFASKHQSKISNFSNFIFFTLSTLVGWEFLHRGFLLNGIIYLLHEKEGIRKDVAGTIAIALVWVFEVVFHFTKPELEAFGLLVGSPILSYLAIRSNSIWLPFFAHIAVEFFFIFALIIR